MTKAIVGALVGLLLMGAFGGSSRRSRNLPIAVSVGALMMLVAATVCGMVWGWPGAVLAAIIGSLVALVIGLRSRRDSHSPRG